MTMAQSDLRRVTSAAKKLERVKVDLRVAILQAREERRDLPRHRRGGQPLASAHRSDRARGTQLKLPMPPE